jgi:hypothetical protein
MTPTPRRGGRPSREGGVEAGTTNPPIPDIAANNLLDPIVTVTD